MIAAAIVALSSVSAASTCVAADGGSLASVDDGCTLTMGGTTVTFSNFVFGIGTQTNSPNGFKNADNTFSFSSTASSFSLTDTGDSNWAVPNPGGQWGFTLSYSVTTAPLTPFLSFGASEGGAVVTGSGTSSIVETSNLQTSTATNVTPSPTPTTYAAPPTSFTVSDAVSSAAGGAGTSNLTSVSNNFTTAPEPISLVLFGSGLIIVGLMAKKRKA